MTLSAKPLAGLVALALAAGCRAEDQEYTKVTGPLEFKLQDIDGKPADLADYKGKVVLLVNVASRCGYTPQYKGLQELYQKYKDDGLVVVGVPANDFGAQEPGSNEQIKAFCSDNYSVSFPMMSKVAVTGAAKAPLYQYLTSKETNPEFAGEVSWNFEKFLIGRDGKVVGRYKSRVKPESPELVNAVEAELKKGK